MTVATQCCAAVQGMAWRRGASGSATGHGGREQTIRPASVGGTGKEEIEPWAGYGVRRMKIQWSRIATNVIFFLFKYSTNRRSLGNRIGHKLVSPICALETRNKGKVALGTRGLTELGS